LNKKESGKPKTEGDTFMFNRYLMEIAGIASRREGIVKI